MTTIDAEIIGRQTDLAQRDVVDVGCGNGALVRELTGLGARVVGIEISDEKLVAARAADDGDARYLVGRAEQLPLDDASTDLVVFRASLHHVPIDRIGEALAEAARVLRPGGLVYAAEPLADGDFYALVSIVDNEDDVRDAAQRALAQPPAGLRQVAVEQYELSMPLAGLESLRRRMVAVDPSRAAAFETHRDELQRRYEDLGEPDGEARRFSEVIRVVVLRAP